MLGAKTHVPDHADVANAIGAVVGQVRIIVDVFVSQPQEGLFAVNGAGLSERIVDKATALERGRAIAQAAALEQASAAGTADAVVHMVEAIDAPIIEDTRTLIEARITATANGRPRVTR